MADVQVNIALENRTLNLVAGEVIRGELVLTISGQKTVKSQSIELKLGWRTHGFGNQDSKVYLKRSLPGGSWGQGEHRIPFELYLSSEMVSDIEQPGTYRGRNLNIDWYLSAALSIPWAFNPRDEVDLIMNELPEAEEIKGEAIEYYTPPGRTAFLVLAGYLGITSAISYFVYENADEWITFLQVGFFFLVGFGFMLFFLKETIQNWLSEKRLGRVYFRIDTSPIQRGQMEKVTLYFTPTKQSYLKTANATLSLQESCTEGYGTNSVTRTVTVYEKSNALSLPEVLASGKHHESSLSFKIPKDEPRTFRSGSNSLYWSIRVDLESQKAKWGKSFQIQVY